MHNLALTLQQQGHTITGSDDIIYDPSQTRLQQKNLLPTEMGWFPDKITANIDTVIVGMHTRKDNPELAKALELKLPVYSYPEFIYQQSQQKQRVVIAGSHGKTTITAMILHVLTYHNRLFDYWIGEPVNGIDITVRLSQNAPIIVVEGDEYASAPVDSRPTFLQYHPHIALISGIAWDHVNLYPTWEEYVDQFESLAEAMPKAGILVFDESDDMLDIIGQKERSDITKIPYIPHPADTIDGKTHLRTKQGKHIPIHLFGEHNLKNIAGAITVCDRIGITDDQFYEAIPTFMGVNKRLDKLAETANRVVFRDFAHSPAKVEATTQAVKSRYPDKILLAVVELHMIDIQNQTFLEQYKGTLDVADTSVVFIDTKALTSESLNSISEEIIQVAFGKLNLRLFTESSVLEKFLVQQSYTAQIFLLMSSESFGGLAIESLADELANAK